MRFLYFGYGVISYLIFFVTFLYAIGFVEGMVVPKTVNEGGADTPFHIALMINCALLGVFAAQHSVMARAEFKAIWTKFIPNVLERSTYVLLSSFALILLFWQWRPMPNPVWDLSTGPLNSILIGLSLLGWLVVLLSTFLISHFELFGLKQVFFHLRGKEMPSTPFRTPILYKVMRHPIYFGFTLAFWSAPLMTQGHLLFAVGTLGYVIVGILLEERDLVHTFGDEYRNYKNQVSMLIPMPIRKG
ncbi:isoprenylcysteine carboxylmethyltransferase family protein [bacterium]|jgi:methanethiol S-methyltransferase|nr:isoprenylcysteine carboxylmethyltransferase family protein [bacterium]